MLKEFYLSFKNSELDAQKIKHIQYNFIKRLNKLKYVSYRRIDISLSVGNTSGDQTVEFEWDDGKTASIIYGLNEDILGSLTSKENIINIYKAVLNCIKILWKKNNWDPDDLFSIYDEIEKNFFEVSVKFGKPFSSPDKKRTAEFVCEVFPEYADYYLQVFEKETQEKRKIKFLKGLTVIELFFGFFNNPYWRDSKCFFITDINKEIFFIINVDNDSCAIEYKPVYNSLEQCKNYVQAFQAGVTSKERLRLLGLPA